LSRGKDALWLNATDPSEALSRRHPHFAPEID
jgi:hypothetical protein